LGNCLNRPIFNPFVFLILLIGAPIAQGEIFSSRPGNFLWTHDLSSMGFGLASYIEETIGAFAEDGTYLPETKAQRIGIMAGYAVRFSENLETYSVVPWLYHSQNGQKSLSLGDIELGARITLWHNLFRGDFPTLRFLVLLKTPTGRRAATPHLPATGNGYWEPGVGLEITKSYGNLRLDLQAAFYKRFGNATATSVPKANHADFSQTASFGIGKKFFVALGLREQIQFASSDAPNGAGSYRISAIGSGAYFIDPSWSISTSFDYGIPSDGFGNNRDALRKFTLSTTYSFH